MDSDVVECFSRTTQHRWLFEAVVAEVAGVARAAAAVDERSDRALWGH